MRAGPGVLARKAARGAAFGDLFNAGRQDVVVNNMHDAPSLLHDCASPAGHSLVVQLIGTRSNRSAIGARVTVSVAGRRLIDEVRSGGSFCSQNDLRIHVGLGTRTRADRIDVAWPSGAAEAISGIDAISSSSFVRARAWFDAKGWRAALAAVRGADTCATST